MSLLQKFARRAKRLARHGLLAVPPVLAACRHLSSANGVTVFMYHDVGGDSPPAEAWQIVRRSDFMRQIDYVRGAYEIVSLDEALRRLSSGSHGSAPAAVITFDDGLRGNFEHLLPIVRKEEIPVAVYVATRHVDTRQNYWFDTIVNALQGPTPVTLDLARFGLGYFEVSQMKGSGNWAQIQRVLQAAKTLPDAMCAEVAEEVKRQSGTWHGDTLAPMTREELAELSRCPQITLGAHTHGHEILTLLDDLQIRGTVSECVASLKRWTGIGVEHFAYPSGAFDGRVETVISDLGFRTAVTTQPGIWGRRHSPFRIPRVSVGRYDSLGKFKADSALPLA
jgi:peptidoglycan/xylan/chitin deacetylase (PgdA/CDA1 family)